MTFFSDVGKGILVFEGLSFPTAVLLSAAAVSQLYQDDLLRRVLLLTRHALIYGDLNAWNPIHFQWGSWVNILSLSKVLFAKSFPGFPFKISKFKLENLLN